MGGAGAESLPLRPQTTGELLDAATNLLRRNALPLIGAGLVLALVEQLALYPLRHAASTHPPWYLPAVPGPVARYWLLLAVGFGTEAVIVTLLGGLAARASVADLTGAPPPRPLIGRGSRAGALALLALILGAGASVGSIVGLVPGLLWYLLAGLAAPALIVDRREPVRPGGPSTGPNLPGPRTASGTPARPATPGRPATGPYGTGRLTAIGPFAAIGRSFTLVTSGRWRPGGVRLVGYLAWWLIRLGLGAGSIALISLLVHPAGTGWASLAAGAAWAIVNAIAYPALGCLDAVVHLETRMRVEGLDIALSRALRGQRPTEPALAVPR
jgi:hypothetical protein